MGKTLDALRGRLGAAGDDDMGEDGLAGGERGVERPIILEIAEQPQIAAWTDVDQGAEAWLGELIPERGEVGVAVGADAEAVGRDTGLAGEASAAGVGIDATEIGEARLEVSGEQAGDEGLADAGPALGDQVDLVLPQWRRGVIVCGCRDGVGRGDGRD